ERGPHVVVRALHIGTARRRTIVDGARIDEDARLVDDVHVRRVGGAVHLPDLALLVQEDRRRSGLARRRQLVGLRWADMALRALGRGEDGQPHHALPRRVLLERLHVAGLVVLPDVGALVIGPLEHDDLSLVGAEAHGTPRGGWRREGRRGFADLGGGRAPRG